MQENNTFKTVLWIIVILAVVAGAIFLITKHKKTSDENMVIGMAPVDTVDVMKLESFPVQINVVAHGHMPDGCTTLGDVKQSYANKKFTITIESKKPLDAEACTLQYEEFTKTISLNGVVGLAKGVYTVSVNGVPGSFTLEMDNFVSETDPLK